MCTVSWIHEDGGYQLFCNRDEKRTRARGSGPQIEIKNGVRRLAPIDGNFGGTWIEVNEFGVTLCLLNGPENPQRSIRRSRGLLLLDLSDAASAGEVFQRLQRMDLSAYNPFRLAVLEPDEPAAVIEWDGAVQAIVFLSDSSGLLVSSSFDADGVRQRRSQEFQRLAGSKKNIDARLLQALHASHLEGPDAYSPCMHRPDAETVSFSRVKVSPHSVEFGFSPGSPCRQCEEEVRFLGRRRKDSSQ